MSYPYFVTDPTTGEIVSSGTCDRYGDLILQGLSSSAVNLAVEANFTVNGTGTAIEAMSFGASAWGLSIKPNGGAFASGQVAFDVPLLESTAYSLSFLARSIGASGFGLYTDLIPDNLPGDILHVVTETPTLFVWNNISTADPDIAVAQVRFFANVPTGYEIQVTDIAFRTSETTIYQHNGPPVIDDTRVCFTDGAVTLKPGVSDYDAPTYEAVQLEP